MSTDGKTALTTIIIACWNQVEFTRHCIASLRRHTRRRPWELIVVDNGSTDGTADYLAGVSDMASVPVTVIKNATNRGFPAAINQGLKAARGEHLVLLNNDVVVTDGWLGQLIGLVNAERSSVVSGPLSVVAEGSAETALSSLPTAYCVLPTAKPIGLSGPMSNYAAPPQLVENVPYRDLHEMHAFARKWRDEHRRTWFTTGKLSGFCLLMKRAVYEKIGGLDERFGLGFFDDDDLAERARRAGFELAVAHDLFVHHFGSRTFQGNGVDAGKLLDENARRFAEKWGLKQANTRPVALRPWRGAGSGVAAPRGLVRPPRPETSQTRSASEGIEELLMRSASGGVGESLAESHHSPAGGSAGPRPPTGTLAGASGWGDSRGDAASTETLAGASGWGDSRGDAASTGTLAGASGWGGGQPGAQHADASVSLTMIVKNEEDHLAKCLESVRGLFDEIVIVDTGSADRTKEIAREFGARIFDFAWIDDFAAARNEALSHATCDYAFWLGADDVVEPEQREKLRVLFAGLTRPSTGDTTSAMSAVTPPLTRPSGDLSPGRGVHVAALGAGPPALGAGLPTPPTKRQVSPPATGTGPRENGLFAYVMRCACPPGPDGKRGGTVVDHVRLFPIRPGVRWTYRVHEQILPSLNRAKIPVRWTDVVIRHDGYADPEIEARKLDRNIEILERELIERPDDPFVLFNLDSSAVQRKEYHVALGLLERSLALSAPRDSIVRKLYALIARVHQMMGNWQEALRTCAAGLKLDRQDAELWHRKAVVHRHRGESSEAEHSWRRILELKRPEQYCSLDDGLYGHITWRNLASLASERGDHAEARRLWQAVLAECPGDRQALARLR